MPNAVLMPKLSSTMTDGSVNEWFVEEGDYVKVGDPLFEVETDKIAIEVESYYEGYVLKKYVGINEEVPCNSIIAYIGEKGTKVQEMMDFLEKDDTNLGETIDSLEPIVTGEAVGVRMDNSKNDKVRATPFARKLAAQEEIDLRVIEGSGREGRIQASDVKTYLELTKAESAKTNRTTLVPWTGMRKAIADNMTYSYSQIPHISMNATANVKALKVLKSKMSIFIDRTITYTDMIAFLTVKALTRYPVLNATTSDKGIIQHQNINLGIAVGLNDGLIVPVIQDAESMGLEKLSQNIKELSIKAHDNNLKVNDTSGGTFTISSLGNTRVKNFTSIINYPQVGILGVGGIYELGGEEYLDVTLTFDHRALDGLPASKFLDYLVDLIENPELSII